MRGQQTSDIRHQTTENDKWAMSPLTVVCSPLSIKQLNE